MSGVPGTGHKFIYQHNNAEETEEAELYICTRKNGLGIIRVPHMCRELDL